MKFNPNTLLNGWQKLKDSPRLRRWMSPGVLVLTLAFLFVLLLHEHEQLRQFDDWHGYLGACAFGFLLYPFSLIVHAWTWSQMIARLGQVQSGWWDIEIYAYTHFLRRLPGAVWYLAARSLMYDHRGVKAGVILVASGLEWLWLVLGGILVYGLFSLKGIGPWLLGLITLAALLGLGVWMPHIKRFLDHWQHMPVFGRRMLDKLEAVALPTPYDLLLWGGAYILTYGVAGAIFFVVAHRVVPTAPLTIGEAMRVWALTSSIGTLVIGLIPAGLGVRELTITALLAPYVPAAAALLVAVLIRLLFIAGDLVWGGLIWSIARLAARYAKRTS